MNTNDDMEMGKTATLSVRLPEEEKERLAALAESTNRSSNFHAERAIAEYLDANAWQVEEIKKAVEKADAGGPFVGHRQAMEHLEALARGENPKAPPTVQVSR
jgi:predicted transcriptional regulator